MWNQDHVWMKRRDEEAKMVGIRRWGTYILSMFTEPLLHCNMPASKHEQIKTAFKNCILSIIVLYNNVEQLVLLRLFKLK